MKFRNIRKTACFGENPVQAVFYSLMYLILFFTLSS